MHIVPMKTPFVSLRMTAYQSVDAPLPPRMGNQGADGVVSSVAIPASASCLCVAT